MRFLGLALLAFFIMVLTSPLTAFASTYSQCKTSVKKCRNACSESTANTPTLASGATAAADGTSISDASAVQRQATDQAANNIRREIARCKKGMKQSQKKCEGVRDPERKQKAQRLYKQKCERYGNANIAKYSRDLAEMERANKGADQANKKTKESGNKDQANKNEEEEKKEEQAGGGGGAPGGGAPPGGQPESKPKDVAEKEKDDKDVDDSAKPYGESKDPVVRDEPLSEEWEKKEGEILASGDTIDYENCAANNDGSEKGREKQIICCKRNRNGEANDEVAACNSVQIAYNRDYNYSQFGQPTNVTQKASTGSGDDIGSSGHSSTNSPSAAAKTSTTRKAAATRSTQSVTVPSPQSVTTSQKSAKDQPVLHPKTTNMFKSVSGRLCEYYRSRELLVTKGWELCSEHL